MSNTTIGILAGMGPRSTAPFVDAVVTQCQQMYGAKLDEEFPQMMIYSLPTPFYIDRPIDHDLMKETIIGGLRRLESTGVDFIAMPCNSAHIYFDDLRESIGVPLLNIIDEALSCLQKSGKSTLLGTRGTLESGMYQSGFERAGLEFLFDSAWQYEIDQTISTIKSGAADSEAEGLWASLLAKLETSRIEQTVIACTDLNVVLPSYQTSMKFVDSTDALAKATVRKYMDTGG